MWQVKCNGIKLKFQISAVIINVEIKNICLDIHVSEHRFQSLNPKCWSKWYCQKLSVLFSLLFFLGGIFIDTVIQEYTYLSLVCPPKIITTKHQQKDKTLQYSSYLVALHLCLHVLKENILVQSKWKQTKNCNPSAHIGQPLPNQSALNLTKNTLSLESQWGLPLQSFSGILTNGLNIYSLCLLL